MSCATPMLVALSWLTLSVLHGAADPPPNILFLIADDLGTRLGCYGDRAAITPNLDRLATEGVLFSRAYAQGSVCIPSRTSFMLGLNNRHASSDHFIRHPETMTMGRWFREHGYQTFSAGKVDHTDEYADPRGWDIRVKIADIKAPVHIKRSRLDEDLGPKRRKVSLIGLADAPEAIHDWLRAERVIQFLKKERDPGRPFFAAVGFHSPHVPWDSPRAIHEGHDPAKLVLEPTPANATPLPARALRDVPGIEMTEARQREGQRGYYAAVTTLDAQVGRLMGALRHNGLWESTVVVFTSDQGYHLGWRGQWCKHSIDEQVLRVPLIVRCPQGARSSRANGIVELLDLFPTFCDVAGLPTPDALDGKSFLPMLEDPKAEGKAAAFASMPPIWGNGRTVRTARWRLVERLDGSRELYDHSVDGAEYYNVINDAGHEPLVRSLHAMLEKEFGPMKGAGPGEDGPSAAE